MYRLAISICLLMLCATKLSAENIRQRPQKVTYTSEQIADSNKIKHLIIIVQENWSFDGIYGKFPGANGLNNASQESSRQVNTSGIPYPILPLCINTITKRPYTEIPNKLPNAPFDLEKYIPITKSTGDLVHRFYQEIFQINGGKMNTFAAFSNADGFVMSYYDITQTRMGKLTQEYTLCDQFFHSCYGGSLLNVLWLFSPQMPVWHNAPLEIVAKLDNNRTLVKDGIVSPEGYVINNAQPFYPPHKEGTPENKRVPPQTYKTIGDLLSEKGVSWGWYAEGWDEAVKGKRPKTFTYAHQAPLYFKQFAPGTTAREEHLFDLEKFYDQLEEGKVPAVCFIRSLGKYSQHPVDGSLLEGLDWCADLIEKIQDSSIWNECAIIVTYDENGGRWDHVAPPLVDAFGPGTRVPAVIISPYAKRGFIDHTTYETVSILKFIEERWGLSPMSNRDAQANNLLNAFDFRGKHHK